MSERETGQRAVGRADRGDEYWLLDVPGYAEWSLRMLEAGESEAVISHLDRMPVILTPDGLHRVTDADFEAMRNAVRGEVG